MPTQPLSPREAQDQHLAQFGALAAPSLFTLAPSDDQRTIDTLRGDVASWRLFALSALDRCAEAQRDLRRERLKLADLREELKERMGVCA